MALPIEDYALLGDTQSAALVGRDGSIDVPAASSCTAELLAADEAVNRTGKRASQILPRRVKQSVGEWYVGPGCGPWRPSP